MLIALLFVGLSGFSQKGTKTISDPVKGNYELIENWNQTAVPSKAITGLDILWHKPEDGATTGEVFYSPNTGKSYVNWQLNDQRVALYGATNVEEWAFGTEDTWALSHANEAGTVYVVVDDTELNVLNPSTGESIHYLSFPEHVRAVAVREDGTGFYITFPENNTTTLSYYAIDGSTPLWSVKELTTHIVSLTLPRDDSRLFAAFAGPEQAIWVLNPETGEVLQDDIYYYNNSPSQTLAVSATAEYLAFGDFSGTASLLRWEDGRYEYVWKANIAGPGASSTWGSGQAISADGKYIAIGTLDFVSNGYNGCLYLFNNYSPEPIWVFENMGDEVHQVAMSDDGSIIGCVSYGPMNHSTPDFYLFRKQSNEPIGDLNTPGSLWSIDMSADGTRCLIGGKATHAREMGSGGNAYLVNCVPTNSGTLSGTVNLDIADDHSGVKVVIEGIDDYFETTAEDGSYTIRFVPEGSYSVSFSIPGYYPQTINDVVISDGEVTNLDVTMEAVGEAVQHLYASQGAYNYVRLIWDAHAEASTGYSIYRKVSENAPFGDPFTVIGPEITEFLDETAVPTTTYYYSVTARLSEDLETPFAPAVPGYVSTSAIVNEIDVYVGTAPTIDGIKAAGEWDDAFRVDVSNYLEDRPMGTSILYFKMDDDFLYVCSENYGDLTFHDNDGVAFYIDDNNDGVFPEPDDDSEGNYWMYYGSSGHSIRYRPIYNTGGVGETMYLPEQHIAFSMTDDCQITEFALPFGDEDWQISPGADQTSGIFLFVRDAIESVWDGKWPAYNDVTFTPTYYGVMNYYATDEVPPAPENLRVDETVILEGQYAPVSWDMPSINDPGHFNVYVNSTSVTNQTEGTQIILDVEQDTEYQVFVTTVDASGQESEQSEMLEFTTGYVNVEEIQTSSFVVFPNPASSSLTISSAISEGGSIKVMDMSGRLIQAFSSTNLQHTNLSVENYKKGAYFVLIHYSDTIVVRKFIVQ